MQPREMPLPDNDDLATDEGLDGPEIAEQDWDDLEAAPIVTGDGSEDGDLQYGTEKDGSLPEEDDDNPDQDSDEALPDDDEEQAIRGDLSGEGIRYKPE